MRLKSLYLFLIACISVPLFSNCITPKVYSGAKVPDSELCMIRGTKEQININGKNYLEAALLVKVDSQVIGSVCKGWPKAVKAKAGERIIEIRHYKAWEALEYSKKASLTETTDDGQKVIPDYFKHYIVRFNADKEKRYVIAFRTINIENTNPEIVLTDELTGTPIEFKVEPLTESKLSMRQ